MAQTSDSLAPVNSGNSAYIQNKSDYLNIKLSLTNSLEYFVVTASNVNYDLRPNDKTITKLALNYRFFSFSYGLAPKFIPGNSDDELKGKSKFSSYTFAFNFNHWVQELGYLKTKSYYLHNTKDYSSGWTEGKDPYIQFPDLQYRSFYGKTAYKFNKRFSFNALSVQTQRQLKSAGTFMPHLSYRYYTVDNRAPLVGQAKTQKTNTFEAILSTAYYYSFVWRQKFYASGGAAPGLGFVSSKITTRSSSESILTRTSDPVYKLELSLALGYNADRFFGGLQVNSAATRYDRSDAVNTIQDDRAYYQIFFGYRLQAPKALKKIADKAEEKKNTLIQSKKPGS